MPKMPNQGMTGMTTGGGLKLNETILGEASRIIDGPRREEYGDAKESFGQIAQLWSAYRGEKFTEFDVIHMMLLLKICRAKNGFHRDSYVDIAGYAGLTERLVPPAPMVTLNNNYGSLG